MNVLVAMSGGVDSSAAAAICKAQGYDVAGVTLKLWGGPSDQGCCSVADVDDARRVAGQLGIDHHVFNMTEAFDALVVDPYVASHRAGLTPNPCIECNRHLKFDALLDATRRLGFDALATGHHARIERSGGVATLHRGVDAAKDQSYVLSMLTQAQLATLLLPVGEMTKAEVRALAGEVGLRTAQKPESQDTCFIESSGGRKAFLSERTTLAVGSIVDDATGAVVGSVEDLELVTVGQRKRLGVDDEGRRRVAVAIDVTRREVRVASPDAAAISELALDPATLTWVNTSVASGTPVLAQLRSHGEAAAAIFLGDRLVFSPSIGPVAPGQTAALYDPSDPTSVLGSAVVAR